MSDKGAAEMKLNNQNIPSYSHPHVLKSTIKSDVSRKLQIEGMLIKFESIFW